jgi:chitodextrinase
MAAKRKAKTEVTYEVQARYEGVWRTWLSGIPTKAEAHERARVEAEIADETIRVVRVERTVVAEVKP